MRCAVCSSKNQPQPLRSAIHCWQYCMATEWAQWRRASFVICVAGRSNQPRPAVSFWRLRASFASVRASRGGASTCQQGLPDCSDLRPDCRGGDVLSHPCACSVAIHSTRCLTPQLCSMTATRATFTPVRVVLPSSLFSSADHHGGRTHELEQDQGTGQSKTIHRGISMENAAFVAPFLPGPAPVSRPRPAASPRHQAPAVMVAPSQAPTETPPRLQNRTPLMLINVSMDTGTLQ